MSVANVLFDVLAPVALLIILGALTGPRLRVDVGTLSRLAYWVFGPAFVFLLLADADLEASVVARLTAAALAGMAAACLAALTWARLRRAPFDVTAAATMTSAYGNVGNAGLAITAFALGDDALPVAGFLMVLINMIGLILGVGLANARSMSPVAAAIRGITAPMTVAGAVALGVNLLDVSLPLIAERSIGLLSGALIPVMLYALGVQLVQSGRPSWTEDLGVILAAKLVTAPLVAGLVAGATGLTGDDLGAVIIQSAMPPAVFCAVVAIENDLVPDRVTAAVVLSTLVSALTLPVVLLIVG